MKIKVAICDDEIIWRIKLKEKIQEISTKYGFEVSIDTFNKVEQLLVSIDTNRYDAIFLDIIIHGINGIAVGKKINEREENIKLIFVSSKDEFIYKSQLVNPLYFVRKSKLKEELNDAFKKLAQVFIPKPHLISLIVEGKKEQLPLEAILYIESRGNYIIIHMKEGSEKKARGTMKKIEVLVKDYDFMRCHKSYLVNFSAIKEIKGNMFILKNNVTIYISQGRKTEIKKQYFNKMVKEN